MVDTSNMTSEDLTVPSEVLQWWVGGGGDDCSDPSAGPCFSVDLIASTIVFIHLHTLITFYNILSKFTT